MSSDSSSSTPKSNVSVSTDRIFAKINLANPATSLTSGPLPRVSCLMPTLPGREEMAKRAVDDFINQTWPNKELVLACSGKKELILPFFDYVQGMTDIIARPFEVGFAFAATESGNPLPLGMMRNITNDHATGDWCCTWDDDDRHHPERIARHMDCTWKNNQADISYLNQQLHIFTDTKEIWWVDWQTNRSPGYVCYKTTTERYPTEGEIANRGEDKMFLRQLAARDYRFAKVETELPLYIRHFHGSNAWGRRHHEVLVRGHSVTAKRIQDNKGRLVDFLQQMQIQPPLRFLSRSGLVFEYT